MKPQDALFGSASRGESVGVDHPGPVRPVGVVVGLRLDGGVPPRIDEEDVIGGQIEVLAARLGDDEENSVLRLVLDGLDLDLPVGWAPVQVGIVDILGT